MEMFSALYFSASILALAAATYTDLKQRIVENRLVYALAGFGLVLKTIESYFAGSLWPLALSLAGAVVAAVFSLALYKLGVWAGGDVKLVSALAILNPLNMAFISQVLGFGFENFTSALPVFPIALIIYSAFSVFPMGLAMAFGSAISNTKTLKKISELAKKKIASIFLVAFAAAGARAIAQHISMQFNMPPIFTEIGSFAGLLVLFVPKRFAPIGAVALAVAALFLQPAALMHGIFYISIPLLGLFLLWIIYSESRHDAFNETIKSSKAEEGMIPASFIVEKNGKLEIVEQKGMRMVIKQLIDNKMQNLHKILRPSGKIIASPLDAGGFELETAEKIRTMALKGLAPAQIRVKKTMPFVPAIFFAYIVLQLSGDFLWQLLI